MSKNSNVNPGQYKVAGRERQGENVVAGDHKARLANAKPVPKDVPPTKSVTSTTPAKKSAR